MRRRAIAVALAAVVALVASCGVPSGGKPIVLGHAAPLGPGSAAGVAPKPNAEFTDAIGFVEGGYLTALAGQISLSAQSAARNAFLDPKKAIKITPGDNSGAQPVTVVRYVGKATHRVNGDETTVIQNVQVIGVFDPSTGALVPPAPSAKSKRLDFTTVTTSTGRLRLERYPAGLYMSEDAFDDPTTGYVPQTIYFWDGDSSLIPDQRYVPRWWRVQLAATAIVNWLLGVPNLPTSFGTAAEPQGKMINGTTLNGPYVTVDSDLNFVVNLTQTSMTPQQLTIFVAEVKWSLLQVPGYGAAPSNTSLPPVKLLIANQAVPQSGDPAAYKMNAAADRGQPSQAPTIGHIQPDSSVPNGDVKPNAYAIEGGRVTPLGYGAPLGVVSAFTNSSPPPTDTSRTLADPKNTDVVTAALATIDGQSLAALVRSVGGHQELWISRAKNGKAKYSKVMTASTFLRPQWLPGGYLAVVADPARRDPTGIDRKFYLINLANQVLPSLPVLGPGAISAFSVGPDGHRVAFVSAGVVWIGFLEEKQPYLSPAHAINLAPDLTSVNAVAWSTVDHLVVGGSGGGKSQVLEVSPDGFYYAELTNSGFYNDTTITQVESYPVSPLDADDSSAVLVATSQKGVVGGRANPQTVNPSLKVTPANPFFADPG